MPRRSLRHPYSGLLSSAVACRVHPLKEQRGERRCSDKHRKNASGAKRSVSIGDYPENA